MNDREICDDREICAAWEVRARAAERKLFEREIEERTAAAAWDRLGAEWRKALYTAGMEVDTMVRRIFGPNGWLWVVAGYAVLVLSVIGIRAFT